jgi:hypothetical protein
MGNTRRCAGAVREVFVTSGALRDAFGRSSLGVNLQFCKLADGARSSIARVHAHKGRR